MRRSPDERRRRRPPQSGSLSQRTRGLYSNRHRQGRPDEGKPVARYLYDSIQGVPPHIASRGRARSRAGRGIDALKCRSATTKWSAAARRRRDRLPDGRARRFRPAAGNRVANLVPFDIWKRRFAHNAYTQTIGIIRLAAHGITPIASLCMAPKARVAGLCRPLRQYRSARRHRAAAPECKWIVGRGIRPESVALASVSDDRGAAIEMNKSARPEADILPESCTGCTGQVHLRRGFRHDECSARHHIH